MTGVVGPRWLGAALVVTAIVVGALLVLRPGAPQTQADVARTIAAELRCPDCAGLSAADSPTRAAAQIRREIVAQLTAGRTQEEIRDSFVARYGPWILLTPPGIAPWLVPLLVTGLGALAMAAWLLRPTGAAASEDAAEISPGATALAVREAASLPSEPSPHARRMAVAIAVGLVVLLGMGFFLPEPFGLAAETVVNQPLAEAQAAEARRQGEIDRLLDQVAADPGDTAALSDLADAYLAGSTAEDLQRAAFVLLALIGQAPDDPEPYGRLITAYIRAEAWTDATAATDALADLEPDSADVPFFRGLIAWQGEGDADAALAAFDEFLAAAPDDPRVPMIRALRAEAAAAGD